MGLAYEIVINSNPCIAYLMEENTMAMQALVIAHAAYGHNCFFKGNYLFRMWTDAVVDHRLPGLRQELHRRVRGAPRHRRGGTGARLLPRADELRRRPLPPAAEARWRRSARRKDREAYLQQQVNDLWRTLPKRGQAGQEPNRGALPAGAAGEHLLYFIEKNAPLLEPWQREIVRIVRKVAQYFYPQRQTQVMNEGWATFWHYTLLNTMYDEGLLSDGFMIELPEVAHQRGLPAAGRPPGYSGINPYALGFAMYTDLRRICENPTDEDRQWFPDIAGSDWVKTLDYAMRNFKDESFIGQYLSPKLMRDFRLFAVLDDASQ